jgi:hypothetical protein
MASLNLDDDGFLFTNHFNNIKLQKFSSHAKGWSALKQWKTNCIEGRKQLKKDEILSQGY